MSPHRNCKLSEEKEGKQTVPQVHPQPEPPGQTGSCQHIENLVIKLASIAPLGIKYSELIKENISEVKHGTGRNAKRGCE